MILEKKVDSIIPVLPNVLQFVSNWIEYDRGPRWRIPLDVEPNGIPFDSNGNGIFFLANNFSLAKKTKMKSR